MIISLIVLSSRHLYHFLPSSTLTIIIRSHTFKYLERMNTERKQDNFQKLNRAIDLLGRRQYFFLHQFLGNHRTNGGSQDRRQQRRPLLTVGSRKWNFLSAFLNLFYFGFFIAMFRLSTNDNMIIDMKRDPNLLVAHISTS